jgi:NADH dehydrogenase
VSGETRVTRPRIVIVGGGFGGLYAAFGLRHADAEIVVIDRSNHHLFQPLLYEVATAALAGPDVATPIRKILARQKNTTVLLAEASGVDAERHVLILKDGEIPYDYLIVATGVTHSYFGHEDWAAHAPGLKTLADAHEIRRRILLAYEHAERETDIEQRQAWLRFVVVGGGPTGVELAGAMADIARRTLAPDFRNFDPREAEILLLEGGERILSTYPAGLAAKAVKQLERLGVRVRTSTQVTGVDADGVTIGTERIGARTVVWAAGVRASALLATLPCERDRAGRALVNPDLSLPSRPDVFVIGDAAHVAGDGGQVPGVAPAAIQMGTQTAANLLRKLRGESTEPFRYKDKGSLATIGRAAAIANFGKLEFSGFFAWMVWLVVHIFFLIGFRNRFIVMFEWAWLYATYQRSARVILDPKR